MDILLMNNLNIFNIFINMYSGRNKKMLHTVLVIYMLPSGELLSL